ncbi:MAG: phage head closure protein [Alphaproteobacteria bacterium]|nr:phage head closure protein [Alphaproteobacteria bacterium]
MIGDMTYRVTIEEAVLTPAGGGGFTAAWQAVATDPQVYASIAPVQSGAALKFGQVEAETTHKIVLRYRTDVTAGMRLVDENGVAYLITAARDRDGRRAYLDVSASVRPGS